MKIRALLLFLLLLVVAPVHAARPYRGGVVASAYPGSAEAALRMLERCTNAPRRALIGNWVHDLPDDEASPLDAQPSTLDDAYDPTRT